ncbi:MAG TPA: alpha/beta hydrolase family protein [Pirellulales bacterium]|nr:alpha/beta hydrolase family protein [Pirellulales bacterium]
MHRRHFLQATTAALCAAARIDRLIAAEPSSAGIAPIGERMQSLETAAPLAMQFVGRTADEARQWQAQFAARLNELLGPYRPPEKWDCILERRVELSDHVREERVLSAAGIAPVPFHLLLPREAKKSSPGIVALHGHSQTANDYVAGLDETPECRAEIARYGDYGRLLVRRGYVVIAPCLTPFGRRLCNPSAKRGDTCTLVNLQLQYLGKLLIAENLRDILWSVEFLARHEAVDPQRIGCVGLSLGGRMTMLAAAVEPRIRAAVISGGLNCLQERALNVSVSGCQSIPGLLNYGDVPEISALIAPRPCVWEVGVKDGLIKPDWAEKALERQRRVYSALGAADQIYVDRHDGGHQWHGTLAYQILDKALRG